MRQCALLSDASASSTAAGRMGRWRKRTPIAAKMALPMAGATTIVPGSPRPTGASTLSMNSMSSSGTSPMRSGGAAVEIRVLHLGLDELRSLVQRHAEAPQRTAFDLRERAVRMNDRARVDVERE